jgi:hypothetical protein
MVDRACDCGSCNECKRAGVDRFSRRAALGAIVGAAVLTTTGQAALARDPVRPPEAMEAEAFKNLKALFASQKAYYSQTDRYTTNLDQLGFAPDEWCEDGARLRIKETPTAFRKVGCHFVYEVETMGTQPQMQFRAYALGVVAPVVGINFLVESSGTYAGIPRRNPK